MKLCSISSVPHVTVRLGWSGILYSSLIVGLAYAGLTQGAVIIILNFHIPFPNLFIAIWFFRTVVILELYGIGEALVEVLLSLECYRTMFPRRAITCTSRNHRYNRSCRIFWCPSQWCPTLGWQPMLSLQSVRAVLRSASSFWLRSFVDLFDYKALRAAGTFKCFDSQILSLFDFNLFEK